MPDLQAIKLQNLKSLGKLTVKGGGLIAFIFPFISTYFSEKARIEMANYSIQDMENRISINAVDL